MTSLERPTSPLLAEPTEAQKLLLETIYDVYREHRRWPVFQYAEALLYNGHGLDARTVLLDCPTVSRMQYGWFWSSDGHLSVRPETVVGLTVAGMAHLERAVEDVQLFLDVLAYLAKKERSFTPHPFEVQIVTVTSADLRRDLGSLTTRQLDSIAEQLSHEPSTWHGKPQSTGPGEWTSTLSPFLRSFAGVTGPEVYVERLTAWIDPPRREEPAGPVSSLALPEAIDYLNAVWRVHFDVPLFRIGRAEAAAKLSHPCGTADEFDARISALCGILDQVRLPEATVDQKLSDLAKYLTPHLQPDSRPRAEAAVRDLQALFALRASRQHPGADERGPSAMQRLGVALPTADWGAAWRHLQGRAIAALAAIREEIDAGLEQTDGGN